MNCLLIEQEIIMGKVVEKNYQHAPGVFPAHLIELADFESAPVDHDSGIECKKYHPRQPAAIVSTVVDKTNRTYV
jgi:hypothetical protein